MEKCNLDSRLEVAYELIQSGTIAVLSLDIFDTLLWRQVPHFEDLFLILGRRFQKEGWLIPAVTPESFVQLRCEAESKARQIKAIPPQISEVTLPEIYWQLQPIFVKLTLEQMIAGTSKGIFPGEVSELVGLELALEKEFIHSDRQIVSLLLFARQKNIPVVLVSDTYFEEQSMRELLTCDPHLSCIQHLFLSCEYGCGKQQGLFNRVVEQLGVPAARILHIGDHEKSDGLAASEAGIRTLAYPKYDNEFEEILEREWSNALSRRSQCLDERCGDFGLTALRAKIANHVDLDSLKSENRFFWKYGAQVLGPILFGFIHWIYERCKAMGQTQVFCLMREGKLYAELIRRFAPYYPEYTLQATPLWVSRVFITHASIGSGNGKELNALIKTFLEQVTVGTFWSYLGLDSSSMGRWTHYRHVMLEDPSLSRALIADLLTDEPVRKQIVHNAATKRDRFLKYLSGLTDLSAPGQMTLVDIGWGGTAQGAMQQILKRNDSPLWLHGLYLGTTQTIHEGLLEGIVREGYLFRGGYPYTGNAHKKGCFVLEQTATAETGVGPLEDIDEEGKIVTHPLWISAKQKQQAEIVQRGIFAFFDHLGPYVRSKEIVLDDESEALHNQLRAVFIRSMTNATEAEAMKFGHWQHEHAPARHLTQTIGKNRYYDDFIKDMLPIAAFKESGLNWLSAYTAKQSKYLTLATQAVWLETLPPQCFLSEDRYSLSVFLDTGRDFPQKAHRHIALRSNPNRHFYTLVRLFSSKKPVQRVRLKLDFPESLVRIRSLRMTVFDRSTPEPKQLTFFENNADSAEIVSGSGQRMNANTFYCDGPLQLIYAFVPQQVYHIRLKLCCEMFKLN